VIVDPALLHLTREALLLALLLSAPPLGAALLVGLLTGVAQAATQVQEQSLGVVPRLAAVLVALAISGPWIGARMVRFAGECLGLVTRIAP
jgi:type III secretory pathway component EscS